MTHLQLEGAPGNARDFLFNRPDGDAREAVLLRPLPAESVEPGAWLAERDIVLG